MQTQMRKKVYNLKSNIADDTYRKVIEHSLKQCDTFLLVVQNPRWFVNSAWHILGNLEPFLIRKKIATQWPGTILFNKKVSADVYSFRLTFESATILRESATSLFAWIRPKLPEDLTFLRSDGSVWLATIAHEKDGYMELTLEEFDALIRIIPELEYLLDSTRPSYLN